MSEPNLNIIAFDIPYPPDYGGSIDIFYKLKSLHEKGVRIILHCFQYNKSPQKELEKYCSEVYYYPRKKGILYQFAKLPYIVRTRNHPDLLKNLLKNDFPILFEGLHSCFFLDHPQLKNRTRIVRTHNIEHAYYSGLQKATPHFFRKVYYGLESRKLKRFEPKLADANVLLTISEADQQYFAGKFERADLVPAFHPFNELTCNTGKGDYFLYHGKLSVEENHNAALFLVEEVFCATDAELILAGSKPGKTLIEACKKAPNIKLIADPTPEKMEELIENAHACVLPTFQSTGLKLKLLISLFSSRFVLVNAEMLQGTSLAEACEIANSKEEFISQINKIQEMEFTQKTIDKRHQLIQKYQNGTNAEKLLKILEDL